MAKTFVVAVVQSFLDGKVQMVYSLLLVDDSLDFDKVKVAVIKAYQLVPETYRQKFSRVIKQEHQTNMEFALVKEALFDHWCTANEVWCWC